MRWFTSDLHFSHKNIIEYCDRPFDTVEEMNRQLVERFNEVVTREDELWVLGDVALGKLDESLGWIAKLNGRKHLVVGNHDKCFINPHGKPGKQSAARRAYQTYQNAGFATIQTYAELWLGSEKVALSHFPYSGDHTEEDRYAWARPKDEGLWLLCGHVHEAWLQRGKQINVGVDVWDWRPVSEEMIGAMILRGSRDRERPPVERVERRGNRQGSTGVPRTGG